MKNHELIEQLKNLRSAAPSNEWKLATERALILHIKGHSTERKVPAWRLTLDVLVNGMKRFAIQPVTLILLVLFTFLGSSLLVNAAFYSLPGDALYPMKIRLEKVQLVFMSDKKQATDLKIELAQKRVDEIGKIISQQDEPTKKTEKVHIAVKTLKQNIDSVKEEMGKKDSTRETNFKIALSLTSNTKELEKAMGNSEGTLSKDAKQSVEKAIDSADDTSITALKESISDARATSSAQTIGDDIKKNEEIKNFIETKIISFEEKVKNLKGYITNNKDIDFSAEIAKIEELIQNTKKSLEAKDFDAALSNIQTIKSILRKIENLGNVGMKESEDSVSMSQADIAPSISQ